MTKKQKDFIDSIKHGGAHSFYKRAFELGVRFEPLKSDPKVIKLSYGSSVIYSKRSRIPLKRSIGDLIKDKNTTKSVLNDIGISVPKGFVYEKAKITGAELEKHKLKFPLIVKPVGSSRAKGVTWDINNLSDLNKAIKFGREGKKKKLIIEEMFIGDEHRILVFNGDAISVVHKMPPLVIGDGKSKIKDLITKYNQNRKPEHRFRLDKESLKFLSKNGYQPNSVPKTGEKVQLKNTFLMSQGARLINVTKNTHNSYKDACTKAVSALNSQIGGVDLIACDITKPGKYVILEVNSSPYYNMHEAELVEGEPVDASGIILKELFPKLNIKS